MEFLWQAHMLNKQYVHKGWIGGRNLLVCRVHMVHNCRGNEHTDLEITDNNSGSVF